jgi:Uma2 family endonuclease
MRQGREVRCVRFAALTAQEATSSMDDVLATVDVRRRRFTVDEYYRMAAVGILTERDRVELIEGEIVEMSPIGLRHSLCVAELNTRLARAVGDRALLWSANPVRLLPDTEPQPDVTLVRPPSRRYAEQPGPADVLLLVEVADTSYRFDRNVKLPLYARAGVPEVWIIDLTRDAVEIHREPSPAGYASERRIERGGTVTPVAFPEVVLAVDDFLPPA